MTVADRAADAADAADTAGSPGAYGDSWEHVEDELGWLDRLLFLRLIERRGSGQRDAFEPFHGLVISEQEVMRLLGTAVPLIQPAGTMPTLAVPAADLAAAPVATGSGVSDVGTLGSPVGSATSAGSMGGPAGGSGAAVVAPEGARSGVRGAWGFYRRPRLERRPASPAAVTAAAVAGRPAPAPVAADAATGWREGGVDPAVHQRALAAVIDTGNHIAARRAATASGVLRLARLAWIFQLSDFEERCILLCLAPEIDRRYEKLYGYLHDDVTRRRPTVGLLLDLLCGSRQEALAARRLFAPRATMQRARLLAVGEDAGAGTFAAGGSATPLLTRPLKLDDRIVEFLLGSDALPAPLQLLAATQPPRPRPPAASPVAGSAASAPAFPAASVVAAMAAAAAASSSVAGVADIASTAGATGMASPTAGAGTVSIPAGAGLAPTVEGNATAAPDAGPAADGAVGASEAGRAELARRMAELVRSQLRGPRSAPVVFYLRGPYGSGRSELVRAVCGELELALVAVDLRRLAGASGVGGIGPRGGAADFGGVGGSGGIGGGADVGGDFGGMGGGTSGGDMGSGGDELQRAFADAARLLAREAVLQPAALAIAGMDELLAATDGRAALASLSALGEALHLFSRVTFLLGESAWSSAASRALAFRLMPDDEAAAGMAALPSGAASGGPPVFDLAAAGSAPFGSPADLPADLPADPPAAPPPGEPAMRPVVEVVLGLPDVRQARDLWQRELARLGLAAESVAPTPPPGAAGAATTPGFVLGVSAADPVSATATAGALASQFRLSPGQIRDAAALAASLAAWRTSGAPTSGATAVTASDLRAACRAQADRKLSQVARKVEPRAGWSDLVLPDDPLAQLHEICDQARHRDVVLGDWGFARRLSQGTGLNVLFAGAPGTGKTMAAEVIAADLELDLYKIDLSQVVSKYIGETEKNLDRVFSAAESGSSILFFDEADALFGKRSEVKDSHDRYANVEISYLLQKMEEYRGVAILATNLRQHLDPAFLRRLAFVVHFPFPDEDSRRRLWQGVWPAATPLAADVDTTQLAQRFKLSGGNIKNIALGAAFLAAAEHVPVHQGHLLRAVRREMQKAGKMLTEAEVAAS
jgi:AAA+ superfamily predicted ATPase